MGNRHAQVAAQRPRSRPFSLSQAFFGCWAGTLEMGQQLQRESVDRPLWRPLRAAMVHALADCENRVWMTAGEATRWRLEQQKLLKGQLTAGEIDDSVGMPRLASVRAGTTRITKPTALACAHFALRLPLPVPAGDSEALSLWFTRRFGAQVTVSRWLGISPDWLADRLRGFEMRDGERIPRPPEEHVIRALAWLDYMGPICPYGPRRPVDAFPRGE